VPATRGDETAQALSDADDARVVAEVQSTQRRAESAKLETEIAALRAQLMDRERRDAELRSEHSKLVQRIDRLLELEQRTYQAVAEKPASPVEYQALPPPSERQLELRAMVRAIDRLDISPEQKRALIQMLHTPRQLDGSNPWDGPAEWH
jgi:hypothetical protein